MNEYSTTDINTLLMEQHREVEDTYKEYLSAETTEEKETLAKKILTDLTVHAALEEDLYYPELEKTGTEGSSLADEYRAEHEQVKVLIKDLAKLDVEDPEFDSKMNVLMDSVEKHVEEEESEGMPKVEELIGHDRLVEIGQQFAKRNQELHDSTIKRLWASITH